MKMKLDFNFMLSLALAATATLAPAARVRAEEPSAEELKKAVAELERRIDLLAAELEKARTGGASESEAPTRGEPGLGPAASKVYGKSRGVSLGGYGEIVYDHPAGERQDGEPSGLEPRVDMLRYVTYVGYKFSDKILLNSEIEFEHASSGVGAEERGEVAVEFAYLEFRPWRNVGFRAGEVLLPVAFLNELHEPPIFHGAHRSEVEDQIVPTTWPENGVGVFGESGAFQWRGYVVAGLNSAGFTSEGIGEGKQEGSQSLARDLGFTGRLDYVGAPGLLLGASFYSGNSGQGATLDERRIGARVTLFDVHAQYERSGFQGRALFARSTVGDVAAVNALNGLEGDASVGERQYGWYLQAAYDLMSLKPKGQWSLTPFLRYERLNPQDRVPAGFAKDPSLDQKAFTAGVDVKPLPNVVAKADYQWRTNAARTGANRFSLAVGYLF